MVLNEPSFISIDAISRISLVVNWIVRLDRKWRKKVIQFGDLFIRKERYLILGDLSSGLQLTMQALFYSLFDYYRKFSAPSQEKIISISRICLDMCNFITTTKIIFLVYWKFLLISWINITTFYSKKCKKHVDKTLMRNQILS